MTPEQTDVIEPGEAGGGKSEPVVLPRLVRVPGGHPDMHETLREAIEHARDFQERRGLSEAPPVRLRMGPELYFYLDNRQYYPWKGQTSILELCESDAQAFMVEHAAFIQEWVERRRTGAGA